MPGPVIDARSTGGGRYGRSMNPNCTVASRTATIDRPGVRRERRPVLLRARLVAAGAGAVVAIALAACSPGASALPLPSSLPSVSVSAAASALSGAALTALDQVDLAIRANTTANGLTADDATSLQQLSTAARTAIQTGDATAARTAVDNLGAKVTALAAKLPAGTGPQLTAALAALKAALPAS